MVDRFDEVYAEVRDHTIVTADRLHVIAAAAVQTAGLSGDMAELGVYRGGTALLIHRMCPEKPLHLFDTFEGLPEPKEDHREVHAKGDFNDTTETDVRSLFDKKAPIYFHKGLFPATATPVADKRFSLVHLDGDYYESTLAGLQFFYPRMVPHGLIILDDYLWPRCPGVEQALQEYLPGRFLPSALYQAVVIKE